MKTKVILNQDVTGLGEEGDIREVAAGFARNFLYPQKLAMPYSKQSLQQLESRRVAIERRKEEKRSAAMGLKERLQAEELQFSVPAGESGKLFGSVNNATIAQELEKRGFTIEKKRIEVPEHNIRMVGTHTVRIHLYGNEQAEVSVVVEPAQSSS